MVCEVGGLRLVVLALDWVVVVGLERVVVLAPIMDGGGLRVKWVGMQVSLRGDRGF